MPHDSVARARIRDHLSLLSAHAERRDEVVLCLDEALANAVLHSGSSEEIEVALSFTGDELELYVRDRGRGFEIASFEPGKPPDPTQTGGRGLYIISELMDEHELRCADGLEVSMVKRSMCVRAAPSRISDQVPSCRRTPRPRGWRRAPTPCWRRSTTRSPASTGSSATRTSTLNNTCNYSKPGR